MEKIQGTDSASAELIGIMTISRDVEVAILSGYEIFGYVSHTPAGLFKLTG